MTLANSIPLAEVGAAVDAVVDASRELEPRARSAPRGLEELVQRHVQEYRERHPDGDLCAHMISLCPLLEALDERHQYAVTDGRRYLYYRARADLDLGIEAGESVAGRPELDAVLHSARTGELAHGCVPGWVFGLTLDMTALPLHDTRGRMRGTMVIFEAIDLLDAPALDRHRELARRLAALHRFNGALGVLVDERDLWERTVQAAIGILGLEYCAIFMQEENRARLTMQHSWGYDSSLQSLSIPLRGGRGITTHAFRDNRIVSVPDVQTDARYVEGCAEVRSELAIPLVVAQRPVGVFSAASNRPDAFTDEEVRLCITLVNQVSLALERIKLFGQVEASRDVLIFALARLAESRDAETGGHLERICGYTRALSMQIRSHPKHAGEFDELFLEDLYRSAALHDIGKVGIPDRILQKTGRLTEDEFEIMKRHTIIGGETLTNAEKHVDDLELLRMGKAIAYYHHEKFDGTGYPYGLSGEEIPIAARITGLADVYDALTSKRCYKEAYSHEIAWRYISGAAGRHFDPDVVRAFQEAEDEILKVKAKYQD